MIQLFVGKPGSQNAGNTRRPKLQYDAKFTTIQAALDYVAVVNDRPAKNRTANDGTPATDKIPVDTRTEEHRRGGFSGIFPACRSANQESAGSPYETVTVTIAPGRYAEILRYNQPNTLVMQGMPTADSTTCVVAAENCESFHKDTENRALFTIGPDTTHVELYNFTIENTHIKTAEDTALSNQAEALCFHNYNGSLIARDMRFISRQDTVHVKGVSWFYNCYIAGDVDFIWGYCDTALFEKCMVFTRIDNRGADYTGMVLQSRALARKKGFVFLDCRFTVALERTGSVYMGCSSGTGAADSFERWDSIALIQCTVSHRFRPELWEERPGKRVWPNPADALTGWREYGTKTEEADGSVHAVSADILAKRHPASIQLTDSDYETYYKSRILILSGTRLEPFVNPAYQSE